MKHWTLLTAILLIGTAAIIVAERQKIDTPASSDAVVFFIGDSEQELTRLPMHLTRISDEDEINIGARLAAQYKYFEGDYKNDTPEIAEARQYVQRVGRRVAQRAERKMPYEFHYIPNPYFVNAFALPGGHVFIGQGLIDLMDSEDELASVLGHEVEHIDLRHCAERVQIEARTRRLGLAGALVQLPIEVFVAGYSKEQELAADREGTISMVVADYSPSGSVRMFEKFARLERAASGKPDNPADEAANVALQGLTDYFRTHPPSELRKQEIVKLIAASQWQVKPETDLEIRYLTLARQAREVCDAHDYDKCIGFARNVLKDHPRLPELQVAVAQAEFGLARFADAAKSYREILGYAHGHEDWERAYADALYASRAKAALEDYRSFTTAVPATSERQAMFRQVDEAGLILVSGAEKPNERFVMALQDPLMVARLAWWYYRAGDHDRALQLNDRAIQGRPYDANLKLQRAWILYDVRRFGDALSMLEALRFDNVNTEYAACLAVNRWAIDDKSAASSLIPDDSAWRNSVWVGALYSKNVASAVVQVYAYRANLTKPRA